MPIYTYRCKKCDHVFEVTQKITDKPLENCCECNGHVHRLIQPIGVIFNGPGFHVNDYGKKPKEAIKET